MKTGAAVLLALLTTSAGAAAAPQATAIPPQQITWVQTGIDPSAAQVLLYTLTVNEEGNPTPRVVGLVNVLCGGTAPNSECSTPLPTQGQPAIITGNVSTLTAKNSLTNLTSPASSPFTGNQGCIFRNGLYPVGNNGQAQTNKQNLSAVLGEFRRAKFQHISTTNLKGNSLLVVERCVGYLVSGRALDEPSPNAPQVELDDVKE